MVVSYGSYYVCSDHTTLFLQCVNTADEGLYFNELLYITKVSNSQYSDSISATPAYH